MKKKWKWSNLYLAIMILLMYFPLVMVVIFSFNESRLSANFTGFSLKWYETLANDRDLKEALFNSILLGVLSCGISAIIGTLGAVGMARVKYKTKGMMEYLSTIPIMIPEIILGMVFLVFFSMLNLPFGMTTLVIAHTTFCIPYIFMMVKARLVGIDKSLEEAARDLGAGPIRTFFDITMPLIAPAVLSGSLLAFAMSFDDVVISIFVNGPRLNTLPVKVYAQLKTGVTPEINALCTIILVVITAVLLLFSFLSKRAEKKY
ncbi:ABC transporter permease [Lachnospiraceae bacterium AM25-11LB]|nr:ABC transporter permease [Lachnospiraceae bacterium AM25-22]RGD09275.1 ABC transporter permease [Lachnospiraceae bacterium AM25-11LB]RJW13502.1 ABC transporter permease [Lachnospiraceae bacterium AM25-40]RJW18214.1 ABC transporter permease [Lachnospiraceae bacterium AM25-39]